ncbi:hypothetical protein N781_08590 [Pontibacillus halophilus JSM 076056 = DSM 19796]|uniref:G5 domain-containing protein n=1 Tax=Pontibacillus halophilus JSM 076056 = DSM 19796 TaxID=1385510 RepID=A0A0A5GFV4_9BACI|nr:G5 and 3D domain-containing protein [Pontibacillus halophilus]KGX90093.1 hypothetical protein N781_08590 [Pontibacillus halophilus JSM 076056 = DSM 19796]
MKKVVLSLVSAIVFFALLGTLTYQATKAEVTLRANDKVQSVRTHADNVGQLLESQDIHVESYDTLSHNKEEKLKNGMQITYESAKEVTVTTNGEEKQYFTTADTVQQFLEENDISLAEHDIMDRAETDSIQEGLIIEVDRAIQVTLNDGGEQEDLWTTKDNVDEFLQEQSVELGELDKVNLESSDALKTGQTVTITRVEKVTDVVEEAVNYATVKRNDNSLSKGKEQVVESGQEGKMEKHYEVILENGEEVSRKLVKEETVSESRDRIVAVGTKVSTPATTSVSTTSNKSETISRNNNGAKKEIYMTATAYTANCSGCSGITSTGINLKANPNQKVVAVDPSVIPLGTKVWVEGYGYAVAGDTGSAIKGNKIDLFIPNQGQARSFGRKQVRVRILK